MKILFIPHYCIPFNAYTIEERPLGGTETAVISLSKGLSDLGHEVIVTTLENNPKLSSPLYIPISSLEDVGPVDIVIAVRSWEPLLYGINTKLKILWTGDSYDQVQNYGIGDLRVQKNIDLLCCVSQWHQKTLSLASGFPLNKTYCLRNGISPNLFKHKVEKVKKRLIYSSTPFRGLKHLPNLYSRLLELHPDCSLSVCSSFDVYAGASQYPKHVIDEYQDTINKLKEMPGVNIIGSIKQAELAKEFLKSEVLAYPNIFEETSCITVLEAKASACIPVTSKKAALPETVGKSGICIEGEPGTESYDSDFIKAIDNIFRNLDVAEGYKTHCRSEVLESDWAYIANQFSNFLLTKL